MPTAVTVTSPTPTEAPSPTPKALPAAFSQTVQTLAAQGHLIAYTPITFEDPVPATWEAGKLFQIIQVAAHEVTPILALGKTGQNLLAVTLHPTSPQAILLDHLQALTTVSVIKTPLSGGEASIAGANKQDDPKPFVTKLRGNTVTTIRALPIQPELLQYFLSDGKLHHPAELHSDITSQPEIPNCDPTALWLQCATTKHEAQAHSTLAIAATQTRHTLPQDTSDTIRNDLEELLSDHATPLLKWLEEAQIIATTIAPPTQNPTNPPPEAPQNGPAPTNQGASQAASPNNPTAPPAPAVEPAPTNNTTPRPEPRNLFHPQVTQTGVPPQPPQATTRQVIDLTTGDPSRYAQWQNPQQWQNPPPAAPQQVHHHHTLAHAQPPSTRFPNPACIPPFPTTWPLPRTLDPIYQPPPPLPQHTITPEGPRQHQPWHPAQYANNPSMLSTDELAQNQINSLLAKPDLTQDELQRVHTFAIIRNATQGQTHAPSIHSDRIYALLGFAGMTPAHTELFHQYTNNIWRDILSDNSKVGREAKVTTNIAHALGQLFPNLKMSLHHDWIKAVANFDFAPQTLPPSEKPGLGPMAYVVRTKSALNAVTYQRDLLQQASSVSTADIAKAKLNTPVVPRVYEELLATLRRMHNVLQFLFTGYCPLAIELATIIRALEEDSGTLSEVDNFQWRVSAEIMWNINVATQKFFENPCTKFDHQLTHRRPDLKRLREAIMFGSFIPAINKPPMFCEPPTNPQRHQRTQQNPPRDSGKRRRTSTPPTKQDAPRPQPHVARLSQDCAGLITKFRNDHKDTRLPSIAQVRQLAEVDSDADLITTLGLQNNDCIRYHFYGRCSYPGCNRIHQHRQTSAKHAPLLTKAIAKAIASKS